MNLETRILKIFNPLKSERSTLPVAGIMKNSLNKLAPQKKEAKEVVASRNIIKLFASASVEIWQRAVHSFLVSTSLTNVSDLWASVAGYYSSHYTVRAIAHLLGIYHLRKKKLIVTLQPSGAGFICEFRGGRNTREHSFYWHRVKQDAYFNSNDLFAENEEDAELSDAGHRNFATYIDHLNNFQNFNPLNIEELKQRIEQISKMEFSSYPIPSKSNYPDLNSVQIVAYHRLVFYRELIDQYVDLENNFWKVHRNPSWCRDIINFQRVVPRRIELAR